MNKWLLALIFAPSIAFAGDLIRIDDSAVKESFCTWHPSDVLCEDDPVDPPVDPNEPIEPPVDPNEPIDPPVDPNEPIDPPVDPNEPIDPPVDPNEPVDPPVDPNEPIDPPVDPCIENPEADGCPCPDDSGSVYPDCPVDPPIDPPVCTEPIAVADSYGNDWAGQNVLANDQNPYGGYWIAQKRAEPENGELSFSSEGTFTYTPDEGYEGPDSFQYAGKNSCGRGNTVSVNVYVGEKPPPDPNEPDLTPVDCTLVDSGEKYPECAVTYKPSFPPLGDYSVSGVCEELDHSTSPFTITMQDREGLDVVYARLKEVSGNTGGTILIPHDVDTVQCDNLWIGKNKEISGPVSIRGVLGPNGEMPRFYCRSDTRDGTIPLEDVEGEFFHLGGTDPILIEQIHGDGYKKGVSNIGRLSVTIRNSYLHHGLSDGIGGSNISGGVGGLDLQMCGSEIAHYGMGNTIHNFYIHRALGGAGDHEELDGNETWSVSTLVDNLIHSSSWSSGYKSIANENNILNNVFWGGLYTDPSYTMRYGSMLVDVPACSINRIIGNELHAVKPLATSLGEEIIGIRNRKTAVRGCDIPQAWTSAGTSPEPIDGEVHTDQYWDDLDGQILFPTIIENNEIWAGGEYGDRYYAINMWGTYWNYEERLGGPACFLQTPDTWYERSRVYADHNTYYGVTSGKEYRNMKIAHSSTCDTQPAPSGPGPSTGMIEAGDGEVYH